ncbi:hypothetical protein [Arthrobacter sp. H14]|uniref:hypothetical protein n=1 Tax=Arthrobacter sp. H14 TaxID=1312959 RepID=UPI00047D5706|nr:hypothetical protein [Arthrobacter sp. H14]
MEPGFLPHIDEHAIDIAASPDAVWPAVILTIQRAFSGAAGKGLARLLGCDSTGVSDCSLVVLGNTFPGFKVEAIERPKLIALTGRHRFSEYALIFRIDEIGGRTRCRAESRARFPNWYGRLYRAAVIGSLGHQILVRRMLRGIRRAAEQTT